MAIIEPESPPSPPANVTKKSSQNFFKNLRRTREAIADRRGLISLDIEFHALVVQAAGNRALMIAREPLSQLLYPVFEAVLTSRLDELLPWNWAQLKAAA